MHLDVSRRAFLVASTVGFAGYQFGRPLQAASSTAAAPRAGGKAKSTILFFLCGGSSHIDTFDTKPDAPLEYRGPFQTIGTSAPEIQLCEHLRSYAPAPPFHGYEHPLYFHGVRVILFDGAATHRLALFIRYHHVLDRIYFIELSEKNIVRAITNAQVGIECPNQFAEIIIR